MAKGVQVLTIVSVFRYIRLSNKRIQMAKFKDNCVPNISLTVRSGLRMKSFADHFSLKSQTFVRLAEKEQTFSRSRMLENRFVARSECHVAHLPFAEIFKDAVRAIPVIVTVLSPTFSSDQDDDGVISRCDYPSLLLTAKAGVDIVATMIRSANFKRSFQLLAPQN